MCLASVSSVGQRLKLHFDSLYRAISGWSGGASAGAQPSARDRHRVRMEGTGALMLDRHHLSASAARNARRKYRRPARRVDEHCRSHVRPLLEGGRRTLPPAIRIAATGRRWECAGPSGGRDTFRSTGRELPGVRSGQRAAGSSQASSRVDVECRGRDRQFLRVGGQERDQPIQDMQQVGRAARGIAHACGVAPSALGEIRGGVTHPPGRTALGSRRARLGRSRSHDRSGAGVPSRDGSARPAARRAVGGTDTPARIRRCISVGSQSGPASWHCVKC